MLPERVLAATEEIGHHRGDAIGERIRLEIVVQRVVAVPRFKTDFDVVVAASVAPQDVVDAPAEVAFHLQKEAAHSARGILRTIREELHQVRMETG